MKYFLERNARKIVVGVVIFFCAINILIWSEVFQRGSGADLAVYFFDVGQGDSEFIESHDGAQILIDGGPSNRVLSLLGQHMSWYDRTIDAIILTHPHADHVTGLIDVLKRYHVGVILESGASYQTPENLEFEKIISEKGIRKIVIDQPMIVKFSDGAELHIVAPTHSFEGETLKNVHDAMIVSELDYENRKILFMGDAEKNLETELIQNDTLHDVDVLKVGHHGSKTSSNENFLKIIRPKYAVISVGKNRYGHPNADALARLAAVGAQIFRTDTMGTLTLSINRGILSWQSEK